MSSSEGKARLSYSHNDGIAEISFSHPKANSLPSLLLEQLAELFVEVSSHPRSRAVFLRSEGRTFCAGASFEEFERLSTVEEATTFFKRFGTLFLAMSRCPKWVVGRIQGKAVGGGVGLLAALDFSVASPLAAVRLSEYALNIGPYVIGPVIERRIGAAAFAGMTLDCQWRDADWCYARGLVDQVSETEESLDSECETLLCELAKRGARATATLKSVAWEQHSDLEERFAARAQMSAEALIATKSGVSE